MISHSSSISNANSTKVLVLFKLFYCYDWPFLYVCTQQEKSLFSIFTAHRNAHIASAVLAIAFPSVCLSVRPSVTRQYCVKTTARSTVQFALANVSSFVETKKYSPETIPSPLKSWHKLTYPLLIGSRTRAFQRA